MADWKGREPVAERVVQLVERRAGSWDLGLAEMKAAAEAEKLGNTMVEQMAVLLVEWMVDHWVAYWVVQLVV